MAQYYEHGVTISDSQKDKLKLALQNKSDVSIKLSNSDLIGPDKLLLTKSQTNKLNKALTNGTGTIIKMSKTQLTKNIKYEGGFLSLLAGLAARALPMIAKTILPALGIGALQGAANSLTQKAIGSGLYLKKGARVCRIETDGSGLYLSPVASNQFKNYGNGLYLNQQGQMYNGKGLILGPNSPFKNIPILGMIL